MKATKPLDNIILLTRLANRYLKVLEHIHIHLLINAETDLANHITLKF